MKTLEELKKEGNDLYNESLRVQGELRGLFNLQLSNEKCLCGRR